MKYDIPCEIAEDLLPSYIDGLTSECVKEHLDSCSKCKEIYNAMLADNENNMIEIDDKKLLEKSKKKISKQIFKVSVCISLVFAITVLLCNAGWYAYWGRRHSVLYNIETVYATRDEKNKDIIHLTYDVTVKNWWFDFSEHTYKLYEHTGGSYSWDWDFNGESEYFTSSNRESRFTINASFNMSLHEGISETHYVEEGSDGSTDREKIMTVIQIMEFAAVDENGVYIDGASLYANDSENINLILDWE